MSRFHREEPRAISIYWDNNLARELFIRIKDKSVTAFLAQRAEVLDIAVDDDDALVRLVWAIDNITNPTSKKRTSVI